MTKRQTELARAFEQGARWWDRRYFPTFGRLPLAAARAIHVEARRRYGKVKVKP